MYEPKFLMIKITEYIKIHLCQKYKYVNLINFQLPWGKPNAIEKKEKIVLATGEAIKLT